MKLSQILNVSTVLVGVLAINSWATNARVEAMGKSTRYIMDDATIFDNAANIGLYPNFLIGEFGSYSGASDKSGDPQSPWFGGLFSYGFGDEGNADPRASIGGVFNRRNEWESYLPDSTIVYEGAAEVGTTIAVPKTITNFDGFLGGSTSEGNLYGAHIFVGVQDGANNEGIASPKSFASIFKADLGINWQIFNDIDFEFVVGAGRVAFGDSQKDFFDAGELSIFGNGRMFSTIEKINGEFVGAGNYSFVQTDGRDITRFALGPGVNVSMDRGFFWLSLEGIYEADATEGWSSDNVDGKVVTKYDSKEDKGIDRMERTGGRIGFGIERNIWYDWLVVRVGGRKDIVYNKCTPSSSKIENFSGAKAFCGAEGNFWSTNPYGDGTSGDHVGFGFGVNVEEKLKVDFTLSESTLFLNPFSAPEGATWISRVSASYSF